MPTIGDLCMLKHAFLKLHKVIYNVKINRYSFPQLGGPSSLWGLPVDPRLPVPWHRDQHLVREERSIRKDEEERGPRQTYRRYVRMGWELLPRQVYSSYRRVSVLYGWTKVPRTQTTLNSVSTWMGSRIDRLLLLHARPESLVGKTIYVHCSWVLRTTEYFFTKLW